jgi:1-acyl-sn-glycerol-3-phosphate acyltransferase
MNAWTGLALLVLSAIGARRLMRACDQANRVDWGHRWLNRLDGLNRIFCRRFHRLRAFGIRLPKTGGAIVVSNHVSGLDPLLLIAAARRPLRFLIAREEYDRWYLRWLFRAVGCIPVERTRNPRAAFAAARRALDSGEVVALFPHGRIVLDHESAPLKRGVAVLARASGSPVVPVRIEGIRGQGLTVAAVWLRSRARLARYPALYSNKYSPDGLLARLAEQLSGQGR